MANEITINSVSGITPPFSGYCCDIYGNQCVFIGVINSIPTVISLTPQFNTAPAIGFKIIQDDGCEFLQTVNCEL
jgi:hypothetical protein